MWAITFHPIIQSFLVPERGAGTHQLSTVWVVQMQPDCDKSSGNYELETLSISKRRREEDIREGNVF